MTVRLERLQAELEPAEYDEMTSGRESAAEYEIDLDDFGGFGVMGALARDCPECGMSGRLIGEIDVKHEVDVDFVRTRDGDFEPYGGMDSYETEFTSVAFACNVCKLTLRGYQELTAAYLDAGRFRIDNESDLGSDFNAADVAERLYGIHD